MVLYLIRGIIIKYICENCIGYVGNDVTALSTYGCRNSNQRGLLYVQTNKILIISKD